MKTNESLSVLQKNESIGVLQNKRRKILDSWMEFQMSDDGLRQDLMSNDDLRAQSEELLYSLLDNLNEESIDDPKSSGFNAVVDILSGISVSRAKRGYSPRETGIYIFSLKDALLKTLNQNIKDPVELYTQSMKISKIVDSFGVTTFETFIKGREEVILRQTGEMDEISTPVIKIWDGILVLPIIGTLDSSRTQIVMENLLQQLVDTGSSIAILDISGVPTVDSLVAQHLLKTVSATRLMGAECILSGIRPEIAQTVVHLGIDLSAITTKSTLASALKTAFGMMQLQVNRRN